MYSGAMTVDNDLKTNCTDDSVNTGSLEIDLVKTASIKYVVLQEYIKLEQRVKAFTVEMWDNIGWNPVAHGTTVGYKRIVTFKPFATNFRVSVTASKASPMISDLKLY